VRGVARYALFVGGGDEDVEAIRLVERVLGGEVLIVDVGGSGLRGWMLWEYGTDRTPLLAAPHGVYYGLGAIRRLLASLKSR